MRIFVTFLLLSTSTTIFADTAAASDDCFWGCYEQYCGNGQTGGECEEGWDECMYLCHSPNGGDELSFKESNSSGGVEDFLQELTEE